MRKIWVFLALALVLASVVSAQGISGVQQAVGRLCGSLKNLLPVASMLMVVIAGVIYAAGQIMGAETRARANVWATAALTGALIGLLIYAIAPSVLHAIYGGTATLDTWNSVYCDETYTP